MGRPLRPLCPVCLRAACPWLVAAREADGLHRHPPEADVCPVGRPAPGFVPYARGRARSVDTLEGRAYIEGYRAGWEDSQADDYHRPVESLAEWVADGRPQGGAE